MPLPPTPTGIFAQVVIPAGTGFSRDDCVNGFYFHTPGVATGTDAERDYVADTLVAFYNDTHSSGVPPLATFISSLMSRTANKAIIKTYDMNDSHPRQPRVRNWTLGAAASSDNGLPTEVACCLSFSTNEIHGKSSRGRVFIGPLHSQVIVLDPPNVHMNGSFTNSLRWAGRFLMDADVGVTNSSKWSVYSRKYNELHPVQNAYVDNEFDTQRRRGHRATIRTAS